jgi:DNA-binding LytR/AlgR family response regulator
MSKIKILIVEDEAIIAEDLSRKLEKAGYKISACVDNGEDALRSAKSNPPDLIFLDISILGAYNGIETAKRLKLIHDFPIIFLTNITDNKTILDAKAVKPANYLIKPFITSQLYVSISMALKNFSEEKEAQLPPPATENTQGHVMVLKDKFFLKHGNGAFHKYDISEVLFIEAERSYCRIFLESGEEILQASSMKEALEKIQHPHLVRVSRSYVINIDKIDVIKSHIVVIKGHEITMSREYAEHVLQRFNILK